VYVGGLSLTSRLKPTETLAGSRRPTGTAPRKVDIETQMRDIPPTLDLK